MRKDNNTSTSSWTDEAIKNVPIFTVVIYCIISLVGVLGNGLVIYVTGFKMKRTVNSIWFLNLALADFLFTAFLIFSAISLAQNQWPFGEFMCKLNTFVIVVNMFASIFLLTTISLDRCLSTWVVVWAQNKRTVCKAKLISAVIWVMAAVCSTPFVTFRGLLTYEGKTRCSYTHDSHEALWILDIFRFVMGFVIPFLVIFVCYVAIGVRAGRLHGIRKRRSLRIIFSVILAFFLCWLPFYIVNFIGNKVNQPIIYRVVGPLTVSLTFLNSCLNPILYVFMCDEFQKKLKKSICFVLESALAEDQLSFMSSRSLSSHLSRISRKSGSVTPVEKEDTIISPDFTECQVFSTDERETMSIE